MPSPLVCSSLPLLHIYPSCVLCHSSGSSLSYLVFESDGDLLASQCPPPACIWGPYILQDVLPCDDMLSAELLGKCRLQTHRDGVLGKAQTGQPSLYLPCLSHGEDKRLLCRSPSQREDHEQGVHDLLSGRKGSHSCYWRQRRQRTWMAPEL